MLHSILTHICDHILYRVSGDTYFVDWSKHSNKELFNIILEHYFGDE